MPTDLDIEREFADIVQTLREDRMEIDPFFSRELDQKVAAGFPREPRWRTAFSSFAPPAVAVSMLVALVVGLASLPSGSDESSESAGGGDTAASTALSDEDATGGSGAGGGAEAAGDAEVEQYQAAPRRQSKSGSQPSPAAAMSPPVPGGAGGSPRTDGRQARKVETSAALVLGAKPGGVQRVVNETVRITGRHRGFVMTSSVDVIDGGGGANLELRVPSDRLQAALFDLSKIADVRERREATQDITQEFVSARSRLADARAERTGLLRQLKRVTTDPERESVKAQLRDVSARISAAKTDLARVNNRASYSTVTVTVVGDPTAGAEEDDGTWTPGDAFKDALRVLEVAAGVLLIALAVSLPLALVAALALVLFRLTQRRRRERLLDAI